MLYKVTLGRDAYLGTPEEVVTWMARAQGAPSAPGVDGPAAYMRGVSDRLRANGVSDPIDLSSALGFLTSLSDAGLLTLEERAEASLERVDPASILGSGPVAFGEGLDLDQLRADTDLFDDEDE